MLIALAVVVIAALAWGQIGADDPVGDAVAPSDTGAQNSDQVEPAASPEAATRAGGGAAADIAAPSVDLEGRKIVKNGTLGVEVERDLFARRIETAARIAGIMGGYVVSTTAQDPDQRDDALLYPQPPQPAADATIVMRVPADKFDDTIKRLGKLGGIVERGYYGEDVSAQYVDSKSRLKHARSVETKLLSLLGEAETVTEALAVQDRLDQVQQRIEVEQGRIQQLDKLSQLATITFHMTVKGEHQQPTDPDSLAGAWDRLVDNFKSVLADTIAALGTILALILIGSILGIGVLIAYRVYHRSRGEASSVSSSASDEGSSHSS